MQTTIVAFDFEREYPALKGFEYRVQEAMLCYYASDVFDEIGYTQDMDFEEALHKASTVLRVAQIPLQDHIRFIFRDRDHQIYRDWKLSALACHLIKLNGSVESKFVAKYQIAMYKESNP